MNREKYIDESWKESAESEKGVLAEAAKDSVQNRPPEGGAKDSVPHTKPRSSVPEASANFLNYITGLGYQILIFLGEIPNPMTSEIDKNLEQARFLIDTLVMLREKTQGNLSKQESDLLDGSIYELQMKYVENSQSENKND